MKILCVGKNYALHAAEMGSQTPSEPIWFWKPESSIIPAGATVEIPEGIGDVHHEVELALRIGTRLKRSASPEDALQAIDAWTVANDCTARQIQDKAKKEGKPWARAKGFDTFLPLGPWQSLAGVELDNMPLQLTINGDVRQSGNTRDMTWGIAQLLHLASQWSTLEPGDILLTGTPAGVGPMQSGDKVVLKAASLVVEHDVTAVRW